MRIPASRQTASDRSIGTRTTILLIAALALAWLAGIADTISAGRPQPLADAPAGMLDCLSYAPFRKPGETPFDPAARVSRERIAEDLRLLSKHTSCVRTYSVDQGLDAVPEVAASLGMQVLLGAWLSRDREQNRIELDRAIALAREHRGTVRALIVGNEVLLRRELPEHELRAALLRSRSEAGVPVTYADVWEFWLQHPELIDAVDFATIHVLPYWEDEPVGIDDAVDHVRSIYRQVEQTLGGAPGGRHTMLIGETGWPSAGRSREEARPGPVEQARFMREFVAMARAERIPYNLIESFDQPWKARLEGAMGAHWGVLDSAGAAKFPWQGPMTASPGWRGDLLWSGAGALLFAAFGFAAGGRSRASAVLAQAFAGGATTLLLLAQWRYMQDWNRDVVEWAATLPFLLATAPLAWLAVADAMAHHAVERQGLARDRAAHDNAAPRIVPALAPPSRRALDALRMLFLFGAAVNVVLLVFDARYRGFPMVFFAVPAAVELPRLALARAALPSDEARLLAWVVACGAVVVALSEGPSNREAMGYCALMLAYALARIGLRPLRSSASAASSAPTADGS